MRLLTLEDYFGNYEKKYSAELTADRRANAEHTVNMANALLALFGEYRSINSGWRPKAVNDRIPGAAKASNHIACKAVDLSDRDLDLARWCVENQDKLLNLGLYMEDPRWTIGWVHLQTISPMSKHRIYIPSSKFPTVEAIQLWLPYKEKLLSL